MPKVKRKTEVLEIMKYPNRRLFLLAQNGKEAAYITVQDLVQMIHNDEDFIVTTKNDRRDITTETLIEAVQREVKTGKMLVTKKLMIEILKGKHAP